MYGRDYYVSDPEPLNSNEPAMRLPFFASTLNVTQWALPLMVSFARSEQLKDRVYVCPTLPIDVLIGVSLVPVAMIRWSVFTVHFFLPTMLLSHCPLVGLLVSMVSACTLMRHDLAPAMAVPLSFIMRLSP